MCALACLTYHFWFIILTLLYDKQQTMLSWFQENWSVISPISCYSYPVMVYLCFFKNRYTTYEMLKHWYVLHLLLCTHNFAIRVVIYKYNYIWYASRSRYLNHFSTLKFWPCPILIYYSGVIPIGFSINTTHKAQSLWPGICSHAANMYTISSYGIILIDISVKAFRCLSRIERFLQFGPIIRWSIAANYFTGPWERWWWF